MYPPPDAFISLRFSNVADDLFALGVWLERWEACTAVTGALGSLGAVASGMIDGETR